MAEPNTQPPTLTELRGRRDEILAIARAHGTGNVRVTGSVARGESGPDSDVDLVVDLEEDRDVLDLSALILDLQEALGRRVDVLEVRGPSRTAVAILRDAVPL